MAVWQVWQVWQAPKSPPPISGTHIDTANYAEQPQPLNPIPLGFQSYFLAV